MERKSWQTLVSWIAMVVIPTVALAQTYPCRRVDTSGNGCNAIFNTFEAHANYESDYADDDDSGETYASASASVQATSDDSAASGSGSCWSECQTSRGNVSYAPEVASEAQMNAVAVYYDSGGYAHVDEAFVANAHTRFEVESGAGSDPVLYGSIYFLISGDESGSNLITYSVVQGRCGGSDVTATTMGLDISIAATLQTENGTVQFWDWYVGDMNVLYTTEEDTSDGNVHDLSSSASYEGYIGANSYSPSGHSEWDMYCETSFVVEER